LKASQALLIGLLTGFVTCRSIFPAFARSCHFLAERAAVVVERIVLVEAFEH